MSTLISSYEIQNHLSGDRFKSYTYRLYQRPFFSFKEKYYLEVITQENGERKTMQADIKVQQCSIETLFGRICFKPFMVIEKEKYQQEIEALNANEQLQHYFAWDTNVFLEESFFHPEDNSYRFMVSAWHLNHVSACRRFLTYVCGAGIEKHFPQQHEQSLVWMVTPTRAELKTYNTRTREVGETLFTHPEPRQIFLLMASNNVFRHFFDWYAILTQLEGKHIAR